MRRPAKKSSRKPPDPRPTSGTQLLVDLANMRDDGIAGFRKKWDSLYKRYTDQELLTRRDELRRVWIGGALWDESGDERLRHVLEGTTAEAKREFEKWAKDGGSVSKLICDHWLRLEKDNEPFIVEWDLRDKRVRIRPNPRSLGAMLAMGCVHLFDRLGFCRNVDCLAPYFMARRRDQKYCTDDCAAPAKREAKLRWWNENRRGKRKPEIVELDM